MVANSRELNQDGLSPIHIAAATGNIEILQELLKVDIGLCFIRGRERRIPLHYASMKGHVDVVKELVLAGVGSIDMVTSRGETALHLAVKNNKFDVLKVLIEHIESSHNLGDVLNKKDEQGNTILHLAAAKKQHKVLDLLLKRSPGSNSGIEVNSLNEVGCTALDVLLLVPSEVGDVGIEHLIRQGGGLRAMDLSRQPVNSHSDIQASNSHPRRTLSKLFKYDGQRDTPTKVRDVLLLIATLITTTTFEATLNPPSMQEEVKRDIGTTARGPKAWPPGPAEVPGNRSFIYTSYKTVRPVISFYSADLFWFFNTLGFLTSLHMINILTQGFPLRLELRVSMMALGISYMTSLLNRIHVLLDIFVLTLIIGLPFIIVIVIRVCRHVSKRRPVEEV
ncbi:UNVERIFIED_CONTAM: hypothetical protein Slati_0316900 [Sesamum latifolium]|uniref:PGG domain-containing protein n=1 Tax=Sesamum latifolium TaxID=2727402 RepID=A0AAW2YEH8_9LAMI